MMNKGEATNAIQNRVVTHAMLEADPRELRLMTHTQLMESANRAFDLTQAEFMDRVYPKYRAAVRDAGIAELLRHWQQQIREVESTDPEIIAENEQRSFVNLVDYMLEQADKELEKFQKRFAEDPAYAFEWGTRTIQAAADKSVAGMCKRRLEAGHTAADVKTYLVESLAYAVRLEGSTSPTSNLVEQAKAIATLRLAGIKR